MTAPMWSSSSSSSPPQPPPPSSSSLSARTMVKNLRCTSIVLGVSNMAVIVLALPILLVGHHRHHRYSCGNGGGSSRKHMFLVLMILFGSVVRIVVMLRCAVHQQAMAISIIGSSPDSVAVGGDDHDARLRRRRRYIKWLWWSRFTTIITILQFVVAASFVWGLVGRISQDAASRECLIGSIHERWKKHVLLSFIIIMCFVALLQCFTSPDVLRWRSFYAAHDNVWKAHYQEVFDHGIREALCCLGRAKYLTAIEEDEVHLVARMLGDIVTYRASGTGHLELLAGLALLQRSSQSPALEEGLAEASDEKIHEATTCHPFAEAAYTGPLLDLGRNFILFPCAWFHRQGILTLWSRNRRPVLKGDNWWRGHAAAFLKYLHLEPGALRHGRVNQANCEAAYFVVVLHHLKMVVIAVRGTETPEDLITDGLCRESSLTTEDLAGLVNSEIIDSGVRQRVISTFPHYGHSGIIEAARELFNQIDGTNGDGNEDKAYESRGFLSSLMGEGCECDGYGLRIVGHSLGGAIAALLGLRLHARYPNLHVYAYGPLPCVDSVVADACSSFITSIIHDSEFSAYLSINSVLRLRAAALMAVSQDCTTDTTMLNRLARLFLDVSKHRSSRMWNTSLPSEVQARVLTGSDTNSNVGAQQHQIYLEEGIDHAEDSLLCNKAQRETDGQCSSRCSVDSFVNPFANDGNSTDDPVSEFMEVVPCPNNRSDQDPPEMLLPGLIIHLVRQKRSIFPLWRGWRIQERETRYKAVIANRENFKDILVSPYMFLDHLPWRCQYALNKVLESRSKLLNTHQEAIV